MSWSRLRWAAGSADARDRADLARWLLVAGAGLTLTALAVHLGARLGTAAAPFAGSYGLHVTPASALAPAVAAAVLLGARRGMHRRLPWPGLLAAAYLAALAWALALALVDGPVRLARPVRDEWSTSGLHPPGPGLLLSLLNHAGVSGPTAVGLLVTALGVLTVPLVLASVRSLCHEPAARRLAPVLVLAPYAVWVVASMDAVSATLGAAMVTCGVLASDGRCRGARSVLGAAVCGLLLGVGALFSYALPWLALSVICVYFVRRRALLNVVTGGFALLPLLAAQAYGFNWPQGLAAAETDFALRVGPHRSALAWGFVSVVVLLLACGPAIVTSARNLRRTPGWPFLVGAVAAVGFAIAAGFARGGMEQAWLPYFPWLLVAAGEQTAAPRPAARAPVLLLGAGALGAVLLAAVLRTPW